MTIGDDDVDYMDIDELEDLDDYSHIAPGIERYNTSDERDALDIVRDVADYEGRVTIAIHDEYSNEMITLFSNDEHSPGMSADYLIEQAGGDLEGYLTGLARDEGYIVQSVDFYQITGYE